MVTKKITERMVKALVDAEQEVICTAENFVMAPGITSVGPLRKAVRTYRQAKTQLRQMKLSDNGKEREFETLQDKESRSRKEGPSPLDDKYDAPGELGRKFRHRYLAPDDDDEEPSSLE